MSDRPDLPNVKILIVDDLPENLLALEALLRRDGLQILRAKSGPEALEVLLANDIALALLDVQMPEMDGFELAELMRGADRTRHVPIIFLTAGTHDQQRAFRGYEVGAVDFLWKPIDAVLLEHKVATFVDLHRQRLERERLANDLRGMLHLNEMFVAAVSHDLRSPLGTVLVGVTLLETEVASADGKRTLGRIRSSATRMRAMLDQLYDLARARVGGGIPIERNQMVCRALVERIVDEHRLAYPGQTITIVDDGGSTDGFWDEARLGQVLANLIGNGLRHGVRESGVQVRITGAGANLIIEVHNQGEIPSALLPHLFDPFRGGEKRASDNLGLGLYIVRQIVGSHGGRVDVTTSAAAGTTFRIELPR